MASSITVCRATSSSARGEVGEFHEALCDPVRQDAESLAERDRELVVGVDLSHTGGWLTDNDESPKQVEAMTALRRHGQPADIADAVAFFASDDARWITGQAVEVNGGLFLGATGER